MKKLLGIIILGLLYFGNAYAKCKEGNCSNGTGTMIWPNGDQYVGEWKDSKTHGLGTMKWSNGTKWVGNWKNGKQDGIGTLILRRQVVWNNSTPISLSLIHI